MRPQTPPNHPRVLETGAEFNHQRLHTPPRALLNMDITQRNMASTSIQPRLHPPIAALVSQRREALVRTNPRLRPNYYQPQPPLRMPR